MAMIFKFLSELYHQFQLCRHRGNRGVNGAAVRLVAEAECNIVGAAARAQTVMPRKPSTNENVPKRLARFMPNGVYGENGRHARKFAFCKISPINWSSLGPKFSVFLSLLRETEIVESCG